MSVHKILLNLTNTLDSLSSHVKNMQAHLQGFSENISHSKFNKVVADKNNKINQNEQDNTFFRKIYKHPVCTFIIIYALFFLTGVSLQIFHVTKLLNNLINHVKDIAPYLIPFIFLSCAILLLSIFMAQAESVPHEIVLAIATASFVVMYVLVIPWKVAEPIVTIMTGVIVPISIYVYAYIKKNKK